MSSLNQNKNSVENANQRLFKILSVYLNLAPDYIDAEMINEITSGDLAAEEFAFASLAASACGLDIYENPADKSFFRSHFLPCFKKLDSGPYFEDQYYKNISFPKDNVGNWAFETRVCKPYEAFVYDDPTVYPDGRILPRIGFFDVEYPFLAVLENGREWMTLMPNEINTTKPALDVARGKVLTYGLGLGYYTYLASLKSSVESVTVVERSCDVIKLFKDLILPQFPEPNKITIIESDAFDFAKNRMANGGYDSVFVDIWHDPSDGCDLLPDATFVYWVEETLKLYI